MEVWVDEARHEHVIGEPVIYPVVAVAQPRGHGVEPTRFEDEAIANGNGFDAWIGRIHRVNPLCGVDVMSLIADSQARSEGR